MGLTNSQRTAHIPDTSVTSRRDYQSILILVTVAVLPSIGLLRISTDAAACWFLLWLSGAVIQAWPRLRARLAPEPLGPVGRASRLALGAIAIWVGLQIAAAVALGHPLTLSTSGAQLNLVGSLALAIVALYLGGNMILAAIKGWSGCEITAAPRAVFRWNVVLVCPLFTPLDLLDALIRRLQVQA